MVGIETGSEVVVRVRVFVIVVVEVGLGTTRVSDTVGIVSEGTVDEGEVVTVTITIVLLVVVGNGGTEVGKESVQ